MILVGGSFASYNGVARNAIARLSMTASLDTSFLSFFDAWSVWKIIIQPNGKILVSGSFTTYDGVAQKGLVRLNADGTRDTTLNVGTGFNFNTGFAVRAMALQPDGKILLGGNFTQYNGALHNQLVRLNTDGTVDSSFQSLGFNSGTVLVVTDIAVQASGRILVGGNFTAYGSNTANYLAPLNADGTFDSTFNLGTSVGYNNSVRSVVVQSDGKVLVGGDFTNNIDGSAAGRISRLNVNGGVDTSFNMGTGFNQNVNAIKLLSNGDMIICGGNQTLYNGTTISSNITRLNADGTFDTSIASSYAVTTVNDVLVV